MCLEWAINSTSYITFTVLKDTFYTMVRSKKWALPLKVLLKSISSAPILISTWHVELATNIHIYFVWYTQSSTLYIYYIQSIYLWWYSITIIIIRAGAYSLNFDSNRTPPPYLTDKFLLQFWCNILFFPSLFSFFFLHLHCSFFRPNLVRVPGRWEKNKEWWWKIDATEYS